MARFTRDCMYKTIDWVTDELSEQLDMETAELHVRVGLHTGPVTAGVLRRHLRGQL